MCSSSRGAGPGASKSDPLTLSASLPTAFLPNSPSLYPLMAVPTATVLAQDHISPEGMSYISSPRMFIESPPRGGPCSGPVDVALKKSRASPRFRRASQWVDGQLADTNVNSVCGGDRNKGKYSGARREGGMGTAVREGIRVRGTSGRDQMELRDGAMWAPGNQHSRQKHLEGASWGRLWVEVPQDRSLGSAPTTRSQDVAGRGGKKVGSTGPRRAGLARSKVVKTPSLWGWGSTRGQTRVSSGRDRTGPGFQKERRSRRRLAPVI